MAPTILLDDLTKALRSNVLREIGRFDDLADAVDIPVHDRVTASVWVLSILVSSMVVDICHISESGFLEIMQLVYREVKKNEAERKATSS